MEKYADDRRSELDKMFITIRVAVTPYEKSIEEFNILVKDEISSRCDYDWKEYKRRLAISVNLEHDFDSYCQISIELLKQPKKKIEEAQSALGVYRPIYLTIDLTLDDPFIETHIRQKVSSHFFEQMNLLAEGKEKLLGRVFSMRIDAIAKEESAKVKAAMKVSGLEAVYKYAEIMNAHGEKEAISMALVSY